MGLGLADSRCEEGLLRRLHCLDVGYFDGRFRERRRRTMASTRARHSASRVASNSRNGRTRDMDQSMAANAHGARPRKNGDFMTAGAGQLKGKCAADLPSAENSDPKWE